MSQDCNPFPNNNQNMLCVNLWVALGTTILGSYPTGVLISIQEIHSLELFMHSISPSSIKCNKKTIVVHAKSTLFKRKMYFVSECRIGTCKQ